MALSMDEQRMLAEIERRLAADDPGLATCLTSFRRPSPVTVLRSPRARIMGSLFTVLLVAMVSLMVYALIPFRTHGARTPATSSTSTHGAVTSSAPPAAANAGTPAASLSAGKSAAPSASASTSTGNAQGAKSQAAGHTTPTEAGP